MEVAHLNNIRTDNRPSNLAYKTPEENKKDAHCDGLYKRGKDRHGAKLTEDEVRIIRASFWSFQSQRETASLFGVSGKTFSRVRRGEGGRTWRTIHRRCRPGADRRRAARSSRHRQTTKAISTSCSPSTAWRRRSTSTR